MEKLHAGPEAKEGGLPRGRWTLALIRHNLEAMQGLSLSGVWYALKRAGVRWRSAYLRQWSPDPEYTAKLAHLCACLRLAGRSEGEIELVFMDEAGFYRWPTPAKNWSDTLPCAFHGGQDNNSQWRSIAGLNARTGQVTYLNNYIVGRKQVIEWYKRLKDAYPNAKTIFVAQDNWSIHTHDDVQQALTAYPTIQPVWLPTYSPWLNPIEKLWRWLKVDYLKMHRLAHDWHQLRRLVERFLDQFSQGSSQLLHYVGLLGDGLLASALRST